MGLSRVPKKAQKVKKEYCQKPSVTFYNLLQPSVTFYNLLTPPRTLAFWQYSFTSAHEDPVVALSSWLPLPLHMSIICRSSGVHLPSHFSTCLARLRGSPDY